MGKALRTYGIPRRKMVLMTKCYRVVCDLENHDPGSTVTMQHNLASASKDYVNQWGISRKSQGRYVRQLTSALGLSRSAIFNSVEASLERLGTTYIDVLQIHRYDTTVPPEETMRALHDLVIAGKVRYIGASSMWTYQLATLQHVAEKNGWTKFVSMQNHYNLLYREEEREMIRYCRSNGIGLIPVSPPYPFSSETDSKSAQWAPLASGKLAQTPANRAKSLRAAFSPNGSMYGEDSLETNAIVSRVCEVSEKRQWPMSHVALAWLNRRVTAPIIGFSSIERMDELLAARGRELTNDEEDFLEELYIPRKVQGHS